MLGKHLPTLRRIPIKTRGILLIEPIAAHGVRHDKQDVHAVTLATLKGVEWIIQYPISS